MSDTDDDIRSHIAELKHERGDCDSNCYYCELEALAEEERADLAEQGRLYDYFKDDLAYDAERER